MHAARTITWGWGEGVVGRSGLARCEGSVVRMTGIHLYGATVKCDVCDVTTWWVGDIVTKSELAAKKVDCGKRAHGGPVVLWTPTCGPVIRIKSTGELYQPMHSFDHNLEPGALVECVVG